MQLRVVNYCRLLSLSLSVGSDPGLMVDHSDLCYTYISTPRHSKDYVIVTYILNLVAMFFFLFMSTAAALLTLEVLYLRKEVP